MCVCTDTTVMDVCVCVCVCVCVYRHYSDGCAAHGLSHWFFLYHPNCSKGEAGVCVFVCVCVCHTSTHAACIHMYKRIIKIFKKI
jgi:hypothetical protein